MVFCRVLLALVRCIVAFGRWWQRALWRRCPLRAVKASLPDMRRSFLSRREQLRSQMISSVIVLTVVADETPLPYL